MYETTGDEEENRGLPRNAQGRVNIANPTWKPPYFGRFLQGRQYFRCRAPLPNAQIGRVGNTNPPRKKRDAAVRHGAPIGVGGGRRDRPSFKPRRIDPSGPNNAITQIIRVSAGAIGSLKGLAVELADHSTLTCAG